MQIERITVRLGKTIPGPEYGGGQYANVKPEIEITAILAPGEQPDYAIKGLCDYILPKLVELKQSLIHEQTRIVPSQPPLQAPAVPVQQLAPPPQQGAMVAQTKPGIQPAVMAPPPGAPPGAPAIPKVDPTTW